MKKLMMALLAMMAVLFGTTACGGSIFGQTRIKGSGNLITRTVAVGNFHTIDASRYILPALIAELRSSVSMFSGETFPCVQMDVYNWEDEVERKDFLAPCDREVYIPGTEIKVPYNYSKRIAVLCSREGTSCSIMRGAYAYALQSIDN